MTSFIVPPLSSTIKEACIGQREFFCEECVNGLVEDVYNDTLNLGVAFLILISIFIVIKSVANKNINSVFVLTLFGLIYGDYSMALFIDCTPGNCVQCGVTLSYTYELYIMSTRILIGLIVVLFIGKRYFQVSNVKIYNRFLISCLILLLALILLLVGSLYFDNTRYIIK